MTRGGFRKGAGRKPSGEKDGKLDIRTSEARLQAWREAAARKSLELTTWVEVTLDREAGR
jgi:hypothetical protein